MHDPTWRSGKNISRHVGSAEFGAKSLFFFFVSLYSVSFFTFIYFLPYCLISLSSYFLPFPRSAPRGLAIHVFLVIDLNVIG